MRSVLAYPGNMADAQHSARALLEAGVLDAFVTTFAFRPCSTLASAIRALPSCFASRLERQLKRRSVTEIADNKIHTYPAWEIARTAATRMFRSPVAADLMWDHASHRFDQMIARHYVPHTQAIHAYEYTALAGFQQAKQLDVARILHLPSLDSGNFEEIQSREKRAWPELIAPHDRYFAGMFEQRHARRRKEIELADVIITNSALTARSHVAAGVDPVKIFPVMLGAPPTICDIELNAERTQRPLVAIWAGSFSLGKGAHYALEAWRAAKAGLNAKFDIYGLSSLPERALRNADQSVSFHGSVPQSELFRAFEAADVLIFPTLSDGFGMVVAEAMAHGLPVITTAQAGACDLVTPDNGIVVPAGDPKALADAIRWCLDNRPRLADMRHHALETAKRRQWSHYRHDLIKTLEIGLRRAGYTPRYERP